MITTRRFRTEILQDEATSGCGIALPFDPHEVYGRTRVPVRVTLRGHTYRTTIAAMDGRHWVPVSRENREAAGVSAGESVTVTIELDEEPRTVVPPEDLAAILASNAEARGGWERLSYTRQKEIVRSLAEAKRAETRARRLARATEELETS